MFFSRRILLSPHFFRKRIGTPLRIENGQVDIHSPCPLELSEPFIMNSIAGLVFLALSFQEYNKYKSAYHKCHSEDFLIIACGLSCFRNSAQITAVS